MVPTRRGLSWSQNSVTRGLAAAAAAATPAPRSDRWKKDSVGMVPFRSFPKSWRCRRCVSRFPTRLGGIAPVSLLFPRLRLSRTEGGGRGKAARPAPPAPASLSSSLSSSLPTECVGRLPVRALEAIDSRRRLPDPRRSSSRGRVAGPTRPQSDKRRLSRCCRLLQVVGFWGSLPERSGLFLSERLSSFWRPPRESGMLPVRRLSERSRKRRAVVWLPVWLPVLSFATHSPKGMVPSNRFEERSRSSRIPFRRRLGSGPVRRLSPRRRILRDGSPRERSSGRLPPKPLEDRSSSTR
mmetsp:Transcript_5450/g.11488  ORF Transcript_5450/g.11488 Transcript_5450/m.11488 type:complete len:296 (+) Transcript_5450:884-1771(+)